MNRKLFLEELSKLKSGAQFIAITNYRNAHEEVANYNIIFHVSYASALRKSIKILKDYIPTSDLEQQAKKELLASYVKSLETYQDITVEAGSEEHYRFFTTNDGKPIKGIKLHKESNELHLYGLIQNKKVSIPGEYPKSNKRPLTIAKDSLREMLPVSRWRQFRINPDQVESITVSNKKLQIK